MIDQIILFYLFIVVCIMFYLAVFEASDKDGFLEKVCMSFFFPIVILVFGVKGIWKILKN